VKTIKVTPAQFKALQLLTRRDLSTLRKHPNLVKEGKHLIRACRKVIRHIEALHQYANARKRQTAYRRIVKVCERALEKVEK